VGRGMRYNRREDLITVRGILVPVEWDESGRVLTTAVSTDQEDEFVIDDNKGEELRVHLRAEVEVTGRLRESEGRRIIRVKKFALLRKFDQPGKQCSD
jgi:hypothetical protein